MLTFKFDMYLSAKKRSILKEFLRLPRQFFILSFKRTYSPPPPRFIETAGVESVQGFLIKLDIKPLMHLLELSIFLLNNDLSGLPKLWTTLSKISKFWVSKSYLKTLIFQVLYLLKMCPIFVSSVHNFVRSNNDVI